MKKNTDFTIPEQPKFFFSPPKKANKKRLNTGSRKDLLVALFALSILKVSKEANDDSLAVRGGNKSHKLDKRINNRVDAYIANASLSISNVFLCYKDDNSLRRWYDNKLQSKVLKLLHKYADKDSTVNLEMLGILILEDNFFGKKALPEFNWLTTNSMYSQDTKMIEDSLKLSNDGIRLYRLKMRAVAYDSISFLKG